MSLDDECVEMTEDYMTDFLCAKHDRYEWKDLEIAPQTFCFQDKSLFLEQHKIFDLWEHDFDIINRLHLCGKLHFHYEIEKKCKPFILKIEKL